MNKIASIKLNVYESYEVSLGEVVCSQLDTPVSYLMSYCNQSGGCQIYPSAFEMMAKAYNFRDDSLSVV